jgi:hypothetical protein
VIPCQMVAKRSPRRARGHRVPAAATVKAAGDAAAAPDAAALQKLTDPRDDAPARRISENKYSNRNWSIITIT